MTLKLKSMKGYDWLCIYSLLKAKFLTLISSFSVYLIQLFAVDLIVLSLSLAAILNSFFASSNFCN